MPVEWGSTFVAALLASTVECIEALTVVLAVGSTRSWRSALTGAAGATVVLALVVALAGRALLQVPLHALQWVVGALLLLFGLRWLHKAILRAAGVVAMHDESLIYAHRRDALLAIGQASPRHDALAFAVAFKTVLLEGTEVVFIVLALGAGNAVRLEAASAGALTALLAVVLVGALVHRPLARVPENTLKFVVGVLLAAFGTFWVGEGMGLVWPGGDWVVPILGAGYVLVAALAVPLCHRRGGLLNQGGAS